MHNHIIFIDLTPQQLRNKVVCDLHFDVGAFRLAGFLQHLCTDSVPTLNLPLEVPSIAAQNVSYEECPAIDNANTRERADSSYCRDNDAVEDLPCDVPLSNSNVAEDVGCGDLVLNNNVTHAASDFVQNTNEPTLSSETPSNTTSTDINTTQPLSSLQLHSLPLASRSNGKTNQRIKKNASNGKPAQFVMRCLHSKSKSAATCTRCQRSHMPVENAKKHKREKADCQE